MLIIGTGAMGIATAGLAAQHGARVTMAGRDRDRLEGAVDAIQTEGGSRVNAIVADVGNPADADRLLRDLPDLGHVAVLIGGSGARASSVTGTPLPVAQQAFDRFWASYNVLQAAAGRLSARGSVTLLSGSSSRRPVAGLAVWGTLHGAIEALARNAVLELAPVRVNTVSPGGIGIGVDRQLTPHAGRAEDIAAAVVAVMSNPAITNALLDVDGGERQGTISR